LFVSVARYSSDMFTIGHIAYRREGVFFPTENALSAGKGGWECTARTKYAIYDCLVVYFLLNKVTEAEEQKCGIFRNNTKTAASIQSRGKSRLITSVSLFLFVYQWNDSKRYGRIFTKVADK